MTRAVLFVSPDYPPTNRSSSLRAYFLAQAFAEAGYTVDVLAEPPASGSADLHRPDKRVTVARIHAPNRVAWLAMALFHVARMAWRRRRVDLIVSTSGPFLAHAVGRFAKRMWPAAFWAADYRDLWSSGNYYSDPLRTRAVQAALQFIERMLLKQSDLITTVSQGLRENLAGFHAREALVFHNGFEPGMDPGRDLPPPADAVRICHTGSLYAERSPVGFLEALKRAHEKNSLGGRNVELVLAGALDGTIERALGKFSNCEYIKHAGVLSRAESYRLQRESDYCLLLEDPGASRKGVLTGKVFEYLGMRKHIIAFGIAEDSEVASILKESGLLAYCGADQAGLEAFLSSLMSGNGNDATPAPNEDLIARFDRSAISRAFVREIARRSGQTGGHG